MSHVEIRKLKGINDTSLVWDTLPFNFTTAQLFRDFLSEFGAYVRGYRIINQDVLNQLTYRQDQKNKVAVILDPASIDTQQGWTSYIEVNPDAVSGSGLLEVDLVPREIAELRRSGRF